MRKIESRRRLPFSALSENEGVRKFVQSSEIEIDLDLRLPPEAIRDITETVIENAILLGTDIPRVISHGRSGKSSDGFTHAAGLQTSIFPFIKPKIVVTHEYSKDISSNYGKGSN